MLISAESEDLLKDLLLFLDTNAPHLKRHAMYQPGLFTFRHYYYYWTTLFSHRPSFLCCKKNVDKT